MPDALGTIDQVKVTVFGPVVNRAARLEGMTKILKRLEQQRWVERIPDPEDRRRSRVSSVPASGSR